MCTRHCFVLFAAIAQITTGDPDSDYIDPEGIEDPEIRAKFGDTSSYAKCHCLWASSCTCVHRSLCKPDGTINTEAVEPGILFRNSAKLLECSGDETCCAVPDDESKFDWSVCGKRSPPPRSSDNHSAPNEFPWMAALLRKDESGRKVFQCGASILNPYLVLTAAHCVDGVKKDDLLIRAGAWNLSDDSEKTQDREIFDIITHPGYKYSPPRNDIALLETTTDFLPGPGIGPVCFLKSTMTTPENECIATGWGSKKYDDNHSARMILKRADLPIVPNKQCEAELRKTYLGKFFRLHKSFMCAGGENKDTCSGDGGGPLVCEIGGTYYQYGLVSWGIGCNVGSLPGVYADLRPARQWLKEQMKRIEEERETDFD